MGSLIGIIDNSSPKCLSARFIHDLVGSFADSFSATQIETGEGCEGFSRSSGAAHAGDGNVIAQEYYELSVEFARRAGDRATEGKANYMLGVVHSYRGDHLQAVEFYMKSLDIAEKEGDLALVKCAEQCLGNSYFVLGNAHLVWLVFIQLFILFLLLLLSLLLNGTIIHSRLLISTAKKLSVWIEKDHQEIGVLRRTVVCD